MKNVLPREASRAVMGRRASLGPSSRFARRALAAISVAALCLCALSAEPAAAGWRLTQSVQGGHPGGAEAQTSVYYRRPLRLIPGILGDSARIDVGVQNSFSPAFDFVGPFVDIKPVAFFDLALSAQAQGYFKLLGYGFHDMPGYGADFATATLAGLPSKNALGLGLAATPTLTLAFGPLVFADAFTVTYFDVDGGRGYFYEAAANCILAKSGLETSNQVFLLVDIGGGLMVGFNDSLLRIPGSDYESQIVHAVGTASTKIGAKASLYGFLLAGLYVEDRYYCGDVHVEASVGLSLAR